MNSCEPYNLEAEAAVAGSFFLEPDLVKACSIQPEQFYSGKLRLIYAAIQSVDKKGKPVDVISVAEELGSQKIESIGGISFITHLAASVPTTANFPFYEKIVKEYDQKRKAIQIAGKMIEKAGEEEISKTLKDGIQDLLEIEEEQTDEDLGEIKTSLGKLYLDCEQDLGEMVGIPSGFHQLDRLTGGFQAEDLIVIGARPSMGKTAFSLNVALHAATENICLIFSLEMSKQSLLKRMVGCVGQINSLKMRNPKRDFLDADWLHFSKAIGKLSNVNLHFFDRAGMDLPYIWSKVRKVRRQYGDQKKMLVVIDYLQLIAGDSKFNQNRQAEISEISRNLKTMARELNVAILALSQLSRGVESRLDKRPVLSDLRESGQIEQDADVIAFLYREDYYSKDSPNQNKIEIILAKQRNGPIGTVELGFLKQYGRFVNLEARTKEEETDLIICS